MSNMGLNQNSKNIMHLQVEDKEELHSVPAESLAEDLAVIKVL